MSFSSISEFIALMEELMPKFKYKEGCKPAVMLGTLYHNTKLSKKDINIIKSQAIKAMVFNTFDIAEIYRIKILKWPNGIPNSASFTYNLIYLLPVNL